jgi:cytochrome c oxidase subunit 2
VRKITLIPLLAALLPTLPAQPPITYDNNPLGSVAEPILIRTYVPDPGLDPEVLSHHGEASKSPKYSPGKGRDVEGEYEMIKVIPAAIAVNHGPALSYVFDTTECRVLYAWQGGFLDFYPYWGSKKGGRRRSFGYVPQLIGNLFYLAEPTGSRTGEPEFIGYELSDKGVPTFRYQLSDTKYAQTILPGEAPLSFTVKTASQGKAKTRTVSGDIISRHQGFERDVKIGKGDAADGEKVFTAFGCMACHSVDGSAGHSPSLAGLFGKKRLIEGQKESVLADEAYLRESIAKPNAKTAKDFPPNYMPPYQLKTDEINALVTYLKTLGDSAPE